MLSPTYGSTYSPSRKEEQGKHVSSSGLATHCDSSSNPYLTRFRHRMIYSPPRKKCFGGTAKVAVQGAAAKPLRQRRRGTFEEQDENNKVRAPLCVTPFFLFNSQGAGR